MKEKKKSVSCSVFNLVVVKYVWTWQQFNDTEKTIADKICKIHSNISYLWLEFSDSYFFLFRLNFFLLNFIWFLFLLLLFNSFCFFFWIIEFRFVISFASEIHYCSIGVVAFAEKHIMVIVYGNKGIYVDYLGRAYCYWTEGTGSKKESHSATEIYVEERQYLFGNSTGKHVGFMQVFVSCANACLCNLIQIQVELYSCPLKSTFPILIFNLVKF